MEAIHQLFAALPWLRVTILRRAIRKYDLQSHYDRLKALPTGKIQKESPKISEVTPSGMAKTLLDCIGVVEGLRSAVAEAKGCVFDAVGGDPMRMTPSGNILGKNYE